VALEDREPAGDEVSREPHCVTCREPQQQRLNGVPPCVPVALFSRQPRSLKKFFT
jgi:hypothetical protein